MKYITFLLSFVAIVFISSIIAIAAPAPALFAYNDTAKQCGSYRNGDENVRYELPAPWQTYDYNKSSAKTVQQYCDELGYTNIGNVVDYLKLQPIKIRDTASIENNNQTKNYNYAGILIIVTVAVALITVLFVAISRSYKGR